MTATRPANLAAPARKAQGTFASKLEGVDGSDFKVTPKSLGLLPTVKVKGPAIVTTICVERAALFHLPNIMKAKKKPDLRQEAHRI